MKPPRSMQPEFIPEDSGEDGKLKTNSHRGMGEDTFRNYMSRKIKLQREQFGIENHLPPPPSPPEPNHNIFCKKPRVGAKEPILERRHKTDEVIPETFSKKPSASMNDMIRSLKEKDRQRRRRKRKRTGSPNDSMSSSVAEPTPPSQKGIDATSTPKDYSTHRRPDLFLRGVVVLVNGYTHPDTDTLQRLLHRHGGDMEKYETFRVTHIIATNLSFAKAKIYRQQRNPIPVVKPEWIVDCVDQKMRLPHAPYLIEEVREKGNQSIAKLFGNAKNHHEQIDMNTSITQNLPKRSPSLMCPSGAESQHSTPMPSRSYFTPDLTQRASSSRKNSSSPLRSQFSQSSDRMAEDFPNWKFEFDSPLVDEEPLTQYGSRHSNTHEFDQYINQSPNCKLSQCDQSKGVLGSNALKSDYGAKSISFDKQTHFMETPVIPKVPNSYEQNSNDKCLEFPSTGEEEVIETKEDAPKSPSVPKVIKGRTDTKYINGKLRTTGTDPDFLKSFFRNSRLSFIGSYKQRAQLSPLKGVNSALRSADKQQNVKRFVFHIDMDCFFASVVLRNYPQYKGKPVAISHHGNNSKDTDGFSVGVSKSSSSECATCNYEARKFGIKKGMFLGRARALCPQLIVLDYDFSGYEEVSQQVASILDQQAAENQAIGCMPALEQVSCDESYLELHLTNDLRDGKDVYDTASSIGQRIRREIEDVTKCTATVGIASNKLLAKLGTDKVKPDGLYVVKDFHDLLEPLKLRELHGVGYRSDEKLNAEGLVTVKDVWDLGTRAESELCRILGDATGKKVLAFCHGRDDRKVKAAERKTIGAECNYGVRFDGPYGVEHMMNGLAEEVEQRMVGIGVWGGKITLKVKQRKKGAKPPPKFLGHGSCHNLSKSIDLTGRQPTNERKVLIQYGMQLLKELAVPVEDIRGMGIIVSKLHTSSSSSGQDSLATWLQPGNKGRVCFHESDKAIGGGEREQEQENSGKFSENKCNEVKEIQVLENRISAAEDISVADPMMDMNDDYILPPPSQIHMSQVNALPSPLKHQIMSKLQPHAQSSTVPADDPPRFDQKQIDNEFVINHRLKQTSVKHHFQLAAVKSGKDHLPGTLGGETVSLTQLECLPLDMQLQIANNGQIKSPPASPTTRPRLSLVSKARASLSAKPLHDHMAVVDLKVPSSEPILPIPVEQNGGNKPNNEETLDTLEKGVPSFYQDNIAPLHSFLDENSPDDEEAINQIMVFFTECSNQWRLCDVVTLLRSIRNRNDYWKDCAYSRILKHLDENTRELTGCNLDTSWLSL